MPGGGGRGKGDKIKKEERRGKMKDVKVEQGDVREQRVPEKTNQWVKIHLQHFGHRVSSNCLLCLHMHSSSSSSYHRPPH